MPLRRFDLFWLSSFLRFGFLVLVAWFTNFLVYLLLLLMDIFASLSLGLNVFVFLFGVLGRCQTVL